MTSNKNIAQNFAMGNQKSRVKNLFIEGNVIYSYGYHFPLAIRLWDNYKEVYLVNINKYSQSTSRHRNLVINALSGNEIIYKDTNFLKRVANNKIIDMKELVAEFGLGLDLKGGNE